MLHVISTIAGFGFKEQGEFDSILPSLERRGYAPLLKSMLDCGWQLSQASAGLYRKDQIFVGDSFRFALRRVEVIGEVLYARNSIHFLLPASGSSTLAITIAKGDAQAAHNAFTTDVETSIRSRLDGRRVRGMTFAWREHSRTGRRSSGDAPPKFKLPEMTEADVNRLPFLQDAPTKEFLRKLSQVGKILESDAAKLATSATIEELVDAQLVDKEYLLSCRQDSHIICALKDAADLQGDAALTCAVCGRSFKDESLRGVYSLSPSAGSLLAASHWMTLWITHLLESEGVDRSLIQWSIESSGEEIDILVAAFERNIVFELKDRDFGLGDAYPFIFRVSRYSDAVGVVVTTGKIALDAKRFIEEEHRKRSGGPQKFVFIEGLNNIGKGIAELIRQLCIERARSIFDPLRERTNVDAWQFIEAKLRRLTDYVAEQSEQDSEAA